MSLLLCVRPCSIPLSHPGNWRKGDGDFVQALVIHYSVLNGQTMDGDLYHFLNDFLMQGFVCTTKGIICG